MIVAKWGVNFLVGKGARAPWTGRGVVSQNDMDCSIYAFIFWCSTDGMVLEPCRLSHCYEIGELR